jgi:uncharacterized protein YjiS (DUF1127 family)
MQQLRTKHQLADQWRRMPPEARMKMKNRIIREAHAAQAGAVRHAFVQLAMLLTRPVQPLYNRLCDLTEKLRHESRLRAAAAELHGMNDRELWDVGVPRSMIDYTVRNPQERNALADLPAMAQQVIGDDAGHHGLADRHRTDADAGIVPSLRENIRLSA